MAENNTALIVIILIVALFLAIHFGYINIPNSNQNNQTGGNNNQNNQGINICQSFTQNYPTYFFVKEQQCNAQGGEYICQSDKLGCYDITTWDNVNMCPSAQVQALKAMCTTMGGNWVCTATEVSCER